MDKTLLLDFIYEMREALSFENIPEYQDVEEALHKARIVVMRMESLYCDTIV